MPLERVDKERLARITDFLQEELRDFKNKFLEKEIKSILVFSALSLGF